MYDFQSNDPSHLPFRKNEIIDIIKQEDTGWWAAMRAGGDTIGWVPEAFVKPLSEEMTDRLLNVREELRVYEYEAEQLYNSAPIARIPLYDPDPEPVAVSPRGPGYRDPFGREAPPSARRPYPPSPMTPMPQPPPTTSAPSISAPINKPTPPTPTDQQEFPPQGRDRSVSAPDTFRNANRRPQPMSTLSETDTSNGLTSRNARPGDKITRITGSDDARVFHHAVQAQANSPWYLRPKHTDQLQIDTDGQVRSGSIVALVEKLTCDTLTKDPISMHIHSQLLITDRVSRVETAQDTTFRNVFLMTFRTFMTADKLFDMLVDTYRMERPPNLTKVELEEWVEKFLFPTQCRVLTIFTVWLEDHRLLEEEPQIAQRLTDFLAHITTPAPQALTAKLIIKTIERLVGVSSRGT
jgi:son of sevenless-like protein